MNEYSQPVRAGACYDAVPCRVMICLLGNFRLLCDGHVVSTRGGGKTEALLAYLGLQSGRRVPREPLVDLLWPDHGLIVELDGRTAHATRAGFEADRRRDNELQLAGFLVLRFTHRRLRQEPEAVIREITAALAVRGGSCA